MLDAVSVLAFVINHLANCLVYLLCYSSSLILIVYSYCVTSLKYRSKLLVVSGDS